MFAPRASLAVWTFGIRGHLVPCRCKIAKRPSNHFEDDRTRIPRCSGMLQMGAGEFKYRAFVLPCGPRRPTVFPDLAASLGSGPRMAPPGLPLLQEPLHPCQGIARRCEAS